MTDLHAPPAPAWHRRVAILLLVVVAVVVGGLLARPLAEDWLRQRIEAVLDDALLLEVGVAGPLVWRLRPQPVLTLHGLSITDGPRVVVSVERVTIELDPAALRRGTLVASRVELQRPALSIEAEPAHWLQPGYWLVAREAGTPAAALVVRELAMHDGRLQVRDGAMSLNVSGLTASLALPQGPASDGSLALAAELAVSAGELALTGRVALSGRLGVGNGVPELSDLALRLVVDDHARGVAGRFEGRVGRQVEQDGGGRFHAKGEVALELPHPAAPGVPFQLLADSRTDWWPARMRAEGRLTGRADRSVIDGGWVYEPGRRRPLHLSMQLDRLDLDAFLGQSEQDDAPHLAAWRNWPLSAELSVGELRWQGLVTTGARLSINAD